MKDFTDTGLDYVAFKDGRCVAIAVKASGRDGLSFNAEILREWGGAGYEVRTLTREEACDHLRAGLAADAAADAAGERG